MLKDHNHDLIHQMSETSDALWRMDEYIKNAEGCESCKALWSLMKADLERHVGALKSEVEVHIREARFE